jgi:uncharacterized membrane-anchored protein
VDTTIEGGERSSPRAVGLGQILNKVPEVTVFFWIIKVLCTTSGETAADFLNVNLNFGLTGTSIVTGLLLLVTLIVQFKAKRYIPAVYWAGIVLISVFGTLVTDNLTDSLKVPLEASTIFFSIALALTFFVWYKKEQTLSMHSITTRRREAFYWLAILFTFALGTAAGDLMAEGLGLGYLVTGLIVTGVIVTTAAAWRLGLNEILAFWMIYILTRPLGASIGDLLSQSSKHGGLGLGTTTTSVIFIGAIIATVAYLSVTKKDVTTKEEIVEETKHAMPKALVLRQLFATIAIVLVLAGGGYYFRQKALQSDASPTAADAVAPAVSGAGTATQAGATTQKAPTSPLGDLTLFKTITQDSLDLVNKGDLAGAQMRITDFEFEWDKADAKLKLMNRAKWTEIDDAADKVFRQLRAVHPEAAGSRTALEALLATLN